MVNFKGLFAVLLSSVICIGTAASVGAAKSDEIRVSSKTNGAYELEIELENISDRYLANVSIKIDGSEEKSIKIDTKKPSETSGTESGAAKSASDASDTAVSGTADADADKSADPSVHTVRSIAPGKTKTLYASISADEDSPVTVLPTEEIPPYTLWIAIGVFAVLAAAAVIFIKKKKKKASGSISAVIAAALLITALTDAGLVAASAEEAPVTSSVTEAVGTAETAETATGTAETEPEEEFPYEGSVHDTVETEDGQISIDISVDYTVVPHPITEELKGSRIAPATDECNTPAMDQRRLVENAGPLTDHKIYIGKNDFMFYGAAIDDYTGNSVMVDARYKKLASMMNERDTWAKENGIKLYLVITPNKSSVYPEYVPKKLTAAEKTNTDLAVEYLAENSTVEVIDLRDALISAKDEYGDTLFYKYDTHWNNNGGFVGYTEIMNRIGKSVSGAYTLKKSDFTVTEHEAYMKDMAYYLGYYSKYSDFGPVYTLKSGMTATIGKKVSDGYWGQYRFCNIWADGYSDALKYITYENTYNEGAPSLYVYRDSFAVSLVHFLKDSFHRSTFDWSYDFSKNEILESGADVVIMEVVEKNLSEFTNSRTFS